MVLAMASLKLVIEGLLESEGYWDQEGHSWILSRYMGMNLLVGLFVVVFGPVLGPSMRCAMLFSFLQKVTYLSAKVAPSVISTVPLVTCWT